MSTFAVLGIDQGTTNTKALLVAADGTVLSKGSVPVALTTPKPGWFEQDGEDIWDSVLLAFHRCLGEAPDVAPVAIAISNQRESVLAWDAATGLPLSPVLGWQDARTADATAALADDDTASRVRQLTGLAVSPVLSAPKIGWLLQWLDRQGIAKDAVRIGTIDSYLVNRLTGAVFATDVGNASRTLLAGLHTLDWHPDLLELFGVPRQVLGEVRASDAHFGTCGALGGIDLPIRAVMGDSHAALYGHGLAHGQAKVTYGTGSSVMAPIDLSTIGELPTSVETTLAWQCGETATYAREGNILATGAALETVAHLLRLTGVGELSDLARQSGSANLRIVPAFAGLGAPYWDREAQGIVVGLARGTRAEDFAYAAIDAVAEQVCDVLDAFAAAGDLVEELLADGGATVNAQLMQLQADLSGLPVTVASHTDASAIGAAAMAWHTLGESFVPASGRRFVPRADDTWRTAERADWRSAVARARGFGVRRTEQW
jgi:glycerol kinase